MVCTRNNRFPTEVIVAHHVVITVVLKRWTECGNATEMLTNNGKATEILTDGQQDRETDTVRTEIDNGNATVPNGQRSRENDTGNATVPNGQRDRETDPRNPATTRTVPNGQRDRRPKSHLNRGTEGSPVSG